jgi:lipopolysaccharide export system protein LptC
MRRAAEIFPLVLALLLAALSYWLDWYVRTPNRNFQAAPDRPDYIVDNFRMRRLDKSGQPAYELVANRMTHYPNDDSTVLDQPRVYDFPRDRAQLSISAAFGRTHADGETVHLHGDVLVHRPARGDDPGMEVRTQYMRLLPRAGIASTNVPVLVTQGRSQLSGDTFYLDSRANTLQVSGRVRAWYAGK